MVDPATVGAAGRTVRCARCKETWVAYPEEETAPQILEPATDTVAADWDEAPAPDDNPADDVVIPVVESPSITSDLPDGVADDVQADEIQPAEAADHDQPAEDAEWTTLDTTKKLRSRTQRERLDLSRSLRSLARPDTLRISLPTICTAMGAIALALVIWRTGVVRLMPQTAAFFRMVGLDVNLRGLAFEDVKTSTELVDNKPVLVIEGNIVDKTRKTIDIPRLRFLVKDANGTEIYAWNAVLEQTRLNPGEKAWFKSRLASPPPEGREIAVRFFNKRDLAAGGL
jgi:hypothetical protein